jgi:hypothetical protein
MTTDAIGRRRRTARPAPRVRRLVLGDADYMLFAAIDRHGPLPTPFLHEFTKHLRRDYTHLQNRLTDFYNGDAGGAYLTRPPQQFAAYTARYQHLVYDLTRRAQMILAERHAFIGHATTRADPFVHRLMCACVGASFELAAPKHGLRYISAGDIISRPAPLAARNGAYPFALPAGTSAIVPDMLFGLEYPGAGFRFFAVECDRSTESIERRNFLQSAFSRKLKAYDVALGKASHRTWWGLPNLHILIVTTSAVHARNILAAVARHIALPNRLAFAVSVDPAFGANWQVPRAPSSVILRGPWQTVEGARDFSVP